MRSRRSAQAEREVRPQIRKTLNRFYGPLILHQITPHRIEQFKRDRLKGIWRAFKQRRSANPVKFRDRES